MKKGIIIAVSVCMAGILAWLVIAFNRTPEIRNIILISIDTCRADYLSCYGYPQETTPHIDAFAKGATRFEYVVSPVPITLPAHCSMLTGRIPPSHGVHHNNCYHLPEDNQTLPEILSMEGFGTAAILSSFVLHSQFGLNQGFDTYDDHFEEGPKNYYSIDRKGLETTRLALDWLDANRDTKSFLFLHYYDPHEPYLPPEPFASEFANSPYAGEIAFTDHCIGRVIQKLKDLDMYDSTLLIITGDHGEMLGEHGEKSHVYFIYESAIRVPLIVKLPGQKTALTVSEPVGLVDIVPTVCSLLDIETPPQVQGRDLSAFLRGEVPDNYERYLYTESVAPNRFGASCLMAISTGMRKYIQAPRPELYDVVADPGETNNLVGKEPHRVRILKDKLRETLELAVRKNSDSKMELDAESIKRLESLGYVAGKEAYEIVFDDTKGDPKDFVHLIDLLESVTTMTANKEYDKARAILEDLVPQAPECSEIFERLSLVGIRQKDYECVVVSLRRVHQLNPKYISDGVYSNLAWVQATRPSLPSRDVDEALEYARRGCEKTGFKDPRSLYILAVAYAAAGDFPKAIETARKAHTLAIAMNDRLLAQEITKRIKLFEQGKPYIEE